MNRQDLAKPVRRSRFRLFLGVNYFRVKRHIANLFGGAKLASQNASIRLKYSCISHQTPLLRQLKDVEMYLQHNKITNIRLASARLDSVLLKPGEEFSYWQLIGRPTAKKGYLPGLVLNRGRLEVGIGGGLCQLSNLIFWMTIHTPLTVVERHRHGYDVFPDTNRSQPFGSGATCFYNYLDLRIKNETDVCFQLKLSMDDENLSGAWLCEEKPKNSYLVYEAEHFFKSEFWGGTSRHNIIRRKTFDENNGVISDEALFENHAIMMYNPFLEQKTS